MSFTATRPASREGAVDAARIVILSITSWTMYLRGAQPIGSGGWAAVPAFVITSLQCKEGYD